MASVALDYETLTDLKLARRIAQRDALAVRVVTRRNNQRLYRTAWSVLKDRAEAEEAVREGYLKAFAAIDSFVGASSLSTWLTRIVLNEALGRRRSAQRKIRVLREQSIAFIDDYRENLMGGSAASSSPEADAARGQVARLLEQAIADLPEAFRIVFMLRDVDGLSVEKRPRPCKFLRRPSKPGFYGPGDGCRSYWLPPCKTLCAASSPLRVKRVKHLQRVC